MLILAFAFFALALFLFHQTRVLGRQIPESSYRELVILSEIKERKAVAAYLSVLLGCLLAYISMKQ